MAWALPERITMNDARACEQALRQAVQTARAQGQTSPWVVDASALRVFDTSALSLLLDAQRQAQAAGWTLQLQGVPTRLQELARLYGVESFLQSGDERA